ncbi:MAG: hypothetical protein LBG74_05160 [Spirochaetaceae bacterium]|jgi:hypothetical protein|nr:hypothetical protein [Spirochaetaceae bacterium]
MKTICKEFDIYIHKKTVFVYDEMCADEDVSAAQPIYTGEMPFLAALESLTTAGYIRFVHTLAKIAPALRFTAHALVCKACAAKKRRLITADRVIRNAFLPPSPHCENAVMAALLADDALAAKVSTDYVPLHGWVIAGVIIVLSLLSVYFHSEFVSINSTQGISYILPLGITIGGVITAYGALFIASHLETLCSKLGLECK